MSDLQREARALGDPNRHRLFRHLVAIGRSAGVAELTELLGIHHNAVRQHLTQLVEVGLVEETTAAPSGRGRPRLEYRVGAAAAGRWADVGPYERLSTMLAEIIRTGDTPEEVGRRTSLRAAGAPSGAVVRSGRDRRHVDADHETIAAPVDVVQVLVDEMARHGFDPTVERRRGRVEIILGTCPFATTALTDPDTVCGLHLGLARGVAESVGGLVVDELVRRDPQRARCRLRCHLEPTDEPIPAPSLGAGQAVT